MAEDSGQERTEQPTPKRQSDARRKGQIPRSKELITLSMLLAAGGAFLSIGDYMLQGLIDLLRDGLTLHREELFDSAILPARFLGTVISAVTMLAPFFALMVMVALLSAVALGGWSFSAEALAFKPEKLDPVKGMGKVFSWRGLVEMFKGLAKFLVVATATVLLLRLKLGTFLGLGNEPLLQGIAHMGHLVGWSFLGISAVLLLVVLVDVPFQLWDHQRQLRMTRQEIKEEHKQTDGSPEVKGRQRRLQMEMAQRRMMEQVPKADVVVTNPTHYAVALRYDQQATDAPVVVAKGTDLLAMKIRGIAAEHDVPVLSAPPLARALYHSAELDRPIPVGLYRAVAQVLAYVYHLRQGAVYQRDGTVPFTDLPIPDDLRRD